MHKDNDGKFLLQHYFKRKTENKLNAHWQEIDIYIFVDS